MKISHATYLKAPFWLIPLAVGIIFLALPFIGTANATLRIIVSIALMAMLVAGLNLVFGIAGELSLGQSAIYAVGAYSAGMLAVAGFDLSVTFVVAIFAAAA